MVVILHSLFPSMFSYDLLFCSYFLIIIVQFAERLTLVNRLPKHQYWPTRSVYPTNRENIPTSVYSACVICRLWSPVRSEWTVRAARRFLFCVNFQMFLHLLLLLGVVLTHATFVQNRIYLRVTSYVGAVTPCRFQRQQTERTFLCLTAAVWFQLFHPNFGRWGAEIWR